MGSEMCIRDRVKFSDQLQEKTRWLVFTKADVTTREEARQLADQYAAEMAWDGPVYLISSINKTGLDELLKDIANYLYADQDDWL